MRDDRLTALESKLLNEVIRPALSIERRDHLGSRATLSETLNFTEVLGNLKSFYLSNGGAPKHWISIMTNHL